MATATFAGILQEIAGFLATGPTPDEILGYRPSPQMMARSQELLDRVKEGRLTQDEQGELNQYVLAERLMRLTWANIHTRRGSRA